MRALDLVRPPPGLATAFRVETSAGGVLNLDDLRGRVVILNFWATWCEPCREELPSMERVFQEYGARGLSVVALAEDREGGSVVRPFVRAQGLTFPTGLDPRQEVARQYRVWVVPSTFVLDRRGVPRFVAQGARDWAGPAARALLETLLAERP